MKTLIMNDSAVMTADGPPSEDADAAITHLTKGLDPLLSLRSGIPLEIVFETDPGAARIGISSADGFLIEALVLLGAGQGRHCWGPFRAWCESLLADGRATGGGPLPVSVPDTDSWNCIILYSACLRLTDEDLGELTKVQVLLARAYVQHFNRGAARRSSRSLN